jgi:acetyltransferase-like isoleucine patch superfamily enzyme
MDSPQTVRLAELMERGVQVVDPRQTYIDLDVNISRIHPTVTLYPGVRLAGTRTLLGPDVVLGREGSVVLNNSLLGAGSSIASGFVEECVILDRARIGANCHLRAGCVLEEEVRTGHAVGLKQTVLMSFVTLGSVINFCDLIMGGGSSRKDHSEVGSGFIHFNFTPWGSHGGKATPSLFGDIVSGVFLRSPRIFMGGAGGVVGPRSVGYGAVVAAGQVVREDVPAGRIVLRPSAAIDRELTPISKRRVEDVRRRNVHFIAQLSALCVWYRSVRLRRAAVAEDAKLQMALLTEAVGNLEYCIRDRVQNLIDFLSDTGFPPIAVKHWSELPISPAPLPLDKEPSMSHLEWLALLSDKDVKRGAEWLANAVEIFRHAML